MTLLNENEILKNIKESNPWWITEKVDLTLAPKFKRKEYRCYQELDVLVNQKWYFYQRSFRSL